MEGFCPEGKRPAGDTGRRYTESSLYAAKETGAVLEAVASVCDSGHDLYVDLGCMRGVIPREEGAVGIREGTVRDIAILSRVGRPVCFTVTDIKNEGGAPLAVLSRARAQRRCIDEYISRLAPGDVIPAAVTHLEPFGAFCDIGCGLIALMPIDSMSVSRIEHPDDRLRAGMSIFAVIKSRVGSRITLSHKELLGTWEENAALFAPGETVTGVVRSVENYGAFVELTPNLAGLAELRDDLKIGQRVSVYIKSMIPSKMKVKLAVIDTLGEDNIPAPPDYFITSGHIDRFVYSPPECAKLVCTDFTAQ